MKRVVDICLALAGLVVLAPVWAAIAVAIRYEDGGPVLLRQERVGRGGRTFAALKFRSMVAGAERLPARQAMANDPRITRTGRLLRATAMDELPQLVNILRGDMSFVGPRPLLAGEIELRGGDRAEPLHAIRGYDIRHSVRPGLTGLAQVVLPRDAARSRKFHVDRIYVRHASLCFDAYLIAVSVWTTLRGAWDGRGQKSRRRPPL